VSEHLDKPVLLAGQSGGRSLSKDKPASSEYINAYMKARAEEAGFGSAMFYSWRRNAGT